MNPSISTLYPLYLALFILVVVCRAEPFSIHNFRNGIKAAVAPRQAPTLIEQFQFRQPERGQQQTDKLEELKLLDIILVASVDGKFHALNRTTGHILWSMADMPAPTRSNRSHHMELGNLVRTQHPPLEDLDGQELYIVEPQSGALFVLPDNAQSHEPLQRLPFTIPYLDGLSPYSYSGDKTFVSKKETSMIALELETGRVIRTVTSDSECIWDAIDEHTPPEDDDLTSLLDNLEAKPKPRPTIVHIARTGSRTLPAFFVGQG